MRTYWIILILILTHISTPNVHICKFKYQIIFDHYAGHHLFDHCADHPICLIIYANIIQLFLFVILT